MPGNSEYGVIPYEVDEITTYLETWLNDNMPGLIDDAVLDAVPPEIVFDWDALYGKAGDISGGWTFQGNVASWLGYEMKANSTAGNRQCGIGTCFVPVEDNYTWHCIHKKTTDSGYIHLLLNNVDMGYIDFYGSGENQLNTLDLGNLSVGHYIVGLWINGKNPSSTAYAMFMNSLKIVRTIT